MGKQAIFGKPTCPVQQNAETFPTGDKVLVERVPTIRKAKCRHSTSPYDHEHIV